VEPTVVERTVSFVSLLVQTSQPKLSLLLYPVLPSTLLYHLPCSTVYPPLPSTLLYPPLPSLHSAGVYREVGGTASSTRVRKNSRYP
jgi:hypothetical protein